MRAIKILRMRTATAGGGGGGSWQAATLPFATTGNVDSVDWSNYTLRQSILSALIPAAFTQVRFSLRGGNAEGIVVSKCYVGIRGTGALDFTATPTAVTWNSGSSSVTIPANTTKMSDAVTLTRTAGQDIVISTYTAAGNAATDTFRKWNDTTTPQNFSAKYKAGDDTTGLTATGYTTFNGTLLWDLFLADLEVM